METVSLGRQRVHVDGGGREVKCEAFDSSSGAAIACWEAYVLISSGTRNS